MKISVFRYSIFPDSAGNSQSSRDAREGALLRVESQNKTDYADCHPWSELGDLPLDEQLEQFASGAMNSLDERMINLSDFDAHIHPADIPESHYLVTDLMNASPPDFCFQVIKVKMGRCLQEETEQLIKIIRLWPDSLSWRLDFNAALDQDSFEYWLHNFPSDCATRLEFIEDPIPYDAQVWRQITERFQVTLALDRAGDPLEQCADGADVLVIKPSVQPADKLIRLFAHTHDFIITHNMGHPLDCLIALNAASRIKRTSAASLRVCGLLPIPSDHPTDFSQMFHQRGTLFLPSPGIGLRFEKKLNALDWEPLYG